MDVPEIVLVKTTGAEESISRTRENDPSGSHRVGSTSRATLAGAGAFWYFVWDFSDSEFLAKGLLEIRRFGIICVHVAHCRNDRCTRGATWDWVFAKRVRGSLVS